MNNDNNNNNQQTNHFDNNNKDITQYSITIYFFNKFFIHLLKARNFLLSNKSSKAQHFVLDYYAKMIFYTIRPDIEVAKVLSARKN